MSKSSFGIAVLGFALCVGLAVVSPIRINVSFSADKKEARQHVAKAVATKQMPVPECDEEFVIVETMPRLIGGIEALQQRINYPESAKEAGEEGTVFVQFLITKEGAVTDAVVLRGVSPALNEEAIRVASESEFTPGRQRGEKVCVKMSLPVTFKL